MSIGGSQAPTGSQQQYDLSSLGLSNGTAPRHERSRLSTFARRMPEGSINSFCGAVAGAASGIVTCPLDVIKTKLQAQGAFRRREPNAPLAKVAYKGMLSTAKIIWSQDGLRGMYRGLGPMMVGYLPTWAVYMSIYGSSRDYYYTQVGKLGHDAASLARLLLINKHKENKWLAQAYASITAGACSTIVTNPIWVVKTRLMSQVGATAAKSERTPWHYKSTVDAFRTMYRTEGFQTFYSGLAPALLGLTHVAIQFPLYEYFKKEFTGLEMGQNVTAHEHGTHWAGVLAATFLSKVCATTATYPHEVLRTRMQTQQRQRKPLASFTSSSPGSYSQQTPAAAAAADHIGKARTSTNSTQSLPQYRGVVAVCRTILIEEGWRAFYYGMGTNLIRAVPSAMTTMFTFEALKSFIHDLQHEGEDS